MMAKKLFPEHADCISMALTPMTLTARLIKRHHSNAKVVFIGPCAAKKLEAMRKSVRSEVDFVLTFEEMAGILGEFSGQIRKASMTLPWTAVTLRWQAGWPSP